MKGYSRWCTGIGIHGGVEKGVLTVVYRNRYSRWCRERGTHGGAQKGVLTVV